MESKTKILKTHKDCSLYENCIEKKNEVIRLDQDFLHFLCVGCWGVYCNQGKYIVVKNKKGKLQQSEIIRGQRQVSKDLIEYTKHHRVTDMYLAGDNVYQVGVEESELATFLEEKQKLLEKITKTNIDLDPLKNYDISLQISEGFERCFRQADIQRFFLIIGNHDRIIMRKAYSSGLSKMWIKGYSEVLGTPGWNFTESIEIDNVLYIHGEGGTARSRARRDLQSIVQGHLHSQAYVEWIVGARFKIFGMQVGCGVNNKSYAMAYGKEGPKPAIACGVVLQGETPINIMMNL